MNITRIVSIYTGRFGSFNPSLEQGVMVNSWFMVTGGISTVATILIILLYALKKNLRMHPNGILMNIMVTQFVVAVKYLVIGYTTYMYAGKQDKL